MITQDKVQEKFRGFKIGVKKIFTKIESKFKDTRKKIKSKSIKEKLGNEIIGLSDGRTGAEKLVWENEKASMQDKSYSFDEETTHFDYESDSDYAITDDESEAGSGQDSRYR